MKYTLLLVSSLLSFTISAQITITSAAFPAVGDTLRTATDNLPTNITITPPGGNQTWIYTSLMSGFTQEQVVHAAGEGTFHAAFPDAEIMINAANNGENYYNVTNNRFELIGFGGQDPLGQGIEVVTRFNPPLVERHATLHFIDNFNTNGALLFPFATDDIPGNIFDNLPISPDSLRVRVAITRNDLVDAWGKITIPGGMYDVLREKRVEIRETRLDAKISFLPWQDITDIALQYLNIPQLGKDTIIRYYFLSNEAKEPIAVVTMNADESAVTSVEYKSNNLTNPVQDPSNFKQGIYAYPNPAMVNVRLEFVNIPSGDYQLQFYNLLGKEMGRRPIAIREDYYVEKLDISWLRQGVYLYSLVDKQGQVLLTRRLMVARP